MTNLRLPYFLLSFFFLPSINCASPDDARPDGMPAQPPALDAIGWFDVRSTYSLAAPPASAAPILAELAAATDGPDDPSRFLIDKLVARLPDGRAQLVAAAVAPYVAAYVQQRIDSFAPRFADGARAMADGLNRIARHFETTETFAVTHYDSFEPRANSAAEYRVERVISGVRFATASGAPVDVAFAPMGIADAATMSIASLGGVTGDRFALGEHAVELPYATLLRAGLDRAVVSQLVPTTTNLAEAFSVLVDCQRLGALVAEYVGVGSPDLYASACAVAMMRLASEIYERIGDARVVMQVSGAARAIDIERDGPMDLITSGMWSGVLGDVALVTASFEGSAP